MKILLKLSIVLIISMLCFSAIAQVNTDNASYNEDPPAMFVEEMPEFQVPITFRNEE